MNLKKLLKIRESISMTIYIDLILLENIVMNYTILVATSIISKSRISLIRSLISATIGSMYSILNYLIELDILTNLLLLSI